MQKMIWILLAVSFLSCNKTTKKTNSTSELSPSEELIQLYKSDQEERKTSEIDWSVVYKRDKERQNRVNELLDANQVKTSDDYANAAMIFQHGSSIKASEMAVKLMQKAVDLDPNRSKWLLAAAIDRDLMRRKEPQIYGTQYTKDVDGVSWELYNLDPTQITDEQRIEYKVQTIEEQKMRVVLMNKKKLFDFYKSGKSLVEIIDYINKNSFEYAEYDLSEGGMIVFGYMLLGENKTEEALSIFKLNTERHPAAYKTHDSYGECLILLGKNEAGVKAYKKSLALNPDNKNATKVIKELGY